jgi:hypothetical protein
MPRDMAMLRHVALYGVSLHAAVSELFFDGKSGGQIVKKLADRGLLSLRERAIPGGVSYARLTAAGCTAAGVPKTRSGPLGSAALDLALGILYFSCLDTRRRYRVERDELVPFFGERHTPMANVPHVASDELGTPCIFRIYHGTGVASELPARLRQVIEKVEQNTAIRPWALTRHYGLAVLGQLRPKVEILRRAIERAGFSQRLPIIVGLGPTAETLSKCLRERGGKSDE